MPADRPPVIANVARLHAAMDRERLAAVVVRSGQNFTYLSGVSIPGTYGRYLDLTDSPRGLFLIWPRHGDAIMVRSRFNEGTERMIAAESWVPRTEAYEAFAEEPLARLCDVIAHAGLAGERIGFETSYLSAAACRDIRERLPKIEMVDGTALLDHVRFVKTPPEIERLRTAAHLLDDVYREVFSSLRPGDTERETHRRMVSACLRRGVDSVHGAWTYGVINTAAGGEPRAFQAGDVLRTDYIAYLRNYPGHQSRNAIFGPPPAAVRDEYRAYRDIYLAALDRCRPGVRASDIFDFIVAAFERQGWRYTQVLVGHSVGAWWHQQEPILARGRDTLLEDGAVIAVEPITERWYLQDMIVVRGNGAELLSDTFPTDEMFVID